METWDEQKISQYISNGIEEGHNLEYKAAKALGRNNSHRDEITKDISSMANASGGVIIDGVSEFQENGKEHLPEKLDPIDRTTFSKEWLEHKIRNIQPRISNFIIHPVSLWSGPNDVAYVVEIPASTTAHQSTSLKYYRRYNFECLAMKDQEIRDVMNRATTPDASVEFSYTKNIITSNEHHYSLVVQIKNLGVQLINHFQLQFTFPQFDGTVRHIIDKRDHIDYWGEFPNTFVIRYRSNNVLYPTQEVDIGREMALQYKVDGHIYAQIGDDGSPMIDWTLHADNMTPKTGSIPFEGLQC